LWFAAVGSAYACAQAGNLLRRLVPSFWKRAAMLTGLLAVSAAPAQDYAATLVERCLRAEPLEIGLGPERQQLVDLLIRETDPSAGALWEDQPGGREPSRWTALLPLLTGRSFIGGLDPTGRIEHSHIGFVHFFRASKTLPHWTDADLQTYCRLYNVGWI